MGKTPIKNTRRQLNTLSILIKIIIWSFPRQRATIFLILEHNKINMLIIDIINNCFKTADDEERVSIISLGDVHLHLFLREINYLLIHIMGIEKFIMFVSKICRNMKYQRIIYGSWKCPPFWNLPFSLNCLISLLE